MRRNFPHLQAFRYHLHYYSVQKQHEREAAAVMISLRTMSSGNADSSYSTLVNCVPLQHTWRYSPCSTRLQVRKGIKG